MPRRLGPRWLGLIAALLPWVLAVGGVFWLPWQYPATTPVNGESYVLGFNNRLAIITLAVAIAVAIIGHLLDRRPVFALGWLEPRLRLPPSPDVPADLVVLTFWTVGWSSFLWWWGGYLADPGWGDARIFHHGMSLLALGQVPYRDFMWNYGPAMLYGPYWLSWLTDGGICFERAYLLTVVLFNAVGYAGIFLIVRTCSVPAAVRPWILLLALLAWAELNLALQYAALRFLVVPSGVIALHAAMRHARAAGRRPTIAAIAAAMAGSCSLAVSPEMGIASAAAIGGYALVLGLRGEFVTAATLLGGCVVPFALMLSLFPAYLLGVFAFATGQYNLPVYPNPCNIALVFACLAGLPPLIASALRSPFDQRSPVALALAVGGGMLVPAAFGRADPIHVSFNGVVPLLLLFPAAAGAGRRWLRCWMAVYAAVMIGVVQWSYWSVTGSYFATAIKMRQFYDEHPDVVARWRVQWERRKSQHPLGHRLHWGSVLPFPKGLNAFAARGLIMQIAGDEWNLWLGRYLLLQPDAPPDYFHPWTQGAVTFPQITRRADVCRRAEYVLIPESTVQSLDDPADLDQYAAHIDQFFSGMLVFPVRCSPKYAPYDPTAMLARLLLKEFQKEGQFQFFMYTPFVICKRKPPS